jgi:glycosyltransferase involved in cell wall biosynthesis
MSQINRQKLLVTLPNKLGGVASFNRNILKFFDSKIIEVNVVLISLKEDTSPKILELINCNEITFFEYSKYENYLYVIKRFSKLLLNDLDFVLCDNSITLQALRYKKCKSKVFFLNHDFFYVKLALEYKDVIDLVICHSSFFNDCLLAADYVEFSKKLIHIPYGVPILDKPYREENRILNLVFLGRLVESKGVKKLIEIEKVLSKRKVNVNWHIIGDGPLLQSTKKEWHKKTNVNFHQPENTECVYSLLYTSDILIFPSSFEGTPVAIYEALGCGCIVIANDIPGGVRDTINSNLGCLVKNNNIIEFVDQIEYFNSNREVLKERQLFVSDYAKKSIEESVRNIEYFNLISKSPIQTQLKKIKDFKVDGILNQWYIPNFISINLRRFIYDR